MYKKFFVGKFQEKIVSSLIMAAEDNDASTHMSYSILWLDPSANTTEDHRHAQKQLRSIIHHLKIFEDKSEFQQYMESAPIHKRFILIVNGRWGREVVPRIHHLPQISSIYVYCMDKKANEQWTKDYSKVGFKKKIHVFNRICFLFETNR